MPNGVGLVTPKYFQYLKSPLWESLLNQRSDNCGNCIIWMGRITRITGLFFKNTILSWIHQRNLSLPELWIACYNIGLQPVTNSLHIWYNVVCHHMVTSSSGNIFRVTGRLWGEFTGDRVFPSQRLVTRSFDVFFDLRLKKRLSKHSWCWWFGTPSASLWRHRNDNSISGIILGMGWAMWEGVTSSHCMAEPIHWMSTASAVEQ